MSYMDNLSLRDILSACDEFKVSKLIVGDLHLEFLQEGRSNAKRPKEEEVKTQEEISILQDEQKLKQDQVENLILENPELYEELVTKGDLTENARSE